MSKNPEDMKRGPVHPGTEKPPCPGVYERDYREDGATKGDWAFSFFDGDGWMFPSKSVEAAAKETLPSIFPRLPWRGQCEVPPDASKAVKT